MRTLAVHVRSTIARRRIVGDAPAADRRDCYRRLGLIVGGGRFKLPPPLHHGVSLSNAEMVSVVGHGPPAAGTCPQLFRGRGEGCLDRRRVGRVGRERHGLNAMGAAQ